MRTRVNFEEQISTIRQAVQQEYQTMLDAQQQKLDDLSSSLQKRLRNFAHPNVSARINWKHDPSKSIKVDQPYAGLQLGERGFSGDLSRFGHGMQRSYMLALLQELIEYDNDEVPTLIMGIEEPELFQHPPQVRHLSEALIELSSNNNQIIVCTHSPHFIPGDQFEKVRMVTECGEPSETKVNQLTYQDLSTLLQSVGEDHLQEVGMVARLYPSINPIVSEMFFCRKLILVEGYEDVAHIKSYLLMSGIIEKFRKFGCHIVPVEGKSNLIKPLAVAKLLNIPTFVVFDLDTDKEEIENPDRRNMEVGKHRSDNRKILDLKDLQHINEWPRENIVARQVFAWRTNLTREVKESLGDNYHTYENQANAHYGNAGRLKKNPLKIAKALEFAFGNDIVSEPLMTCINHVDAFLEE